MNLEKIKKSAMKDDYAKQIIAWNYLDEYAVYNLPAYDECVEKNYGIVNPNKRDNYIVYILDGEVVFYVNTKLMDNDKVYVGVGLKPEYCGLGLSSYFLTESNKDIRKKYPDNILYLEVRSWNTRAIRAYEKIGYVAVNKIIKKDRLGNDEEFTEMEYK